MLCVKILRVDCLGDCVGDCRVSVCLIEWCILKHGKLALSDTRMTYTLHTILKLEGDILHHCSNVVVANLTDDRYAAFTDITIFKCTCIKLIIFQ